MRVTAAAVAIAFGALMGLGPGGCVDDCPLVRQQVFVVNAEPDLQGLIDECRATRLGSHETCQGQTSSSQIVCGCLPLCRRLLEIIDQFPGEEAISGCELSLVPTVDAGAQSRAAEVVVTYRPSSCP